jgi:hypothetical protein
MFYHDETTFMIFRKLGWDTKWDPFEYKIRGLSVRLLSHFVMVALQTSHILGPFMQ